MWYNPIMRGLLNSPMHFFASKNMMLMTYKGRKSGKTYTVPMGYLENGDALYTISSRDRVWWRNLRGGAGVTLRVRGEDVQARAEAIEDEGQVATDLCSYFKAAPRLAKYMKIRINTDGTPSCEDVRHLAQEKVIVKTAAI
jgi:deazaflavin-dependent oxidoreductase (nitroreductase family)